MKCALVIVLTSITMLGVVGRSVADDAYETCILAEGADFTQCGDEWLQREQAGLDIGWQAMLAQTDGSVRDALLSEQAAWTAFYQTSCSFMRDPVFAPGGDRSSFYTCRAGVLSERAREVATYTGYIDN